MRRLDSPRGTQTRFHTYLIVAAATVLVVTGGGLLGWYIDIQPSTAGPTPTVTVTGPAETVTEPAPRRPRKYITETVPGPTITETVPGPTITVTKTVQTPGPTVTRYTSSPTEETTPTVGAAALKPGPMALSVDTATDPAWQVERAARIWNRALGCKVFTLDPAAADGQPIYWVSEVEPGSLMLDGQHVRALHTGRPVYTIELDPKWGVESYIPIHELGHALGLAHNDLPGSIMNVGERDRALPTSDDVAAAKYFQVQNGRCQP